MFAAALALVALALGAAEAVAAGPAARADARLDRALAKLVTLPGGPPGVAAVVQRGGQRRFHNAGVASLRGGGRWRPDDHMRLASTAKAFSGAAALALVGRGELALDEPVRARLPWLPEAWGEVTLAELLQHTSGLPDFSRAPAFQRQFGNHPYAYLAPRELVGYVADEPLRFTPGSAYEYSNTDNVVVALLAAAAEGRNYSQVLRRRVYRPLRLRSTSLPVGARLPAPHARGYLLSPPDPPTDVTTAFAMSGAWASGGLQSTPADLNRFVRGYIGGRLFGAAVQRRQLSFVKGHSEPPGPGVNSVGLGVFRYRTKCGVVYGHTGNIPGFTQFMAASRDGRRSVTVSVNAQITPGNGSPQVRAAFKRLRRTELLAVCAALAG